MFLTGDIRLAGVDDTSRPFALIRDAFRNEDIVFGNLEGALSDEIDPYEYYAKLTWRHSGTQGAPALRDANIGVVGLANNVIIGDQAIRSTLSILDSLGIAHTGAGLNLQEARAPAIAEVGGVRYGFIQRTSIFWPNHHKAVPDGPTRLRSTRYAHGLHAEGQMINFYGAPGVATIRPHTAYEPSYASMFEAGGAAIIHTWPDEFDLADYVEDIRALRPKVDVLVTAHHWRVTSGLTHESAGPLARDFRTEIAHAAIDAGADIVAAHGTHDVEEIEIYNGKAIFYGLGELFFGTYPDDPPWPPRPAWKNVKLIARLEMDGPRPGRVSARFVVSGGRAEAYQTRFRRPEEEPEALAHLADRSARRFGTRLQVEGDSVTVVP